eukprot:122762-Chlamydomonas_euryale.AAC.3
MRKCECHTVSEGCHEKTRRPQPHVGMARLNRSRPAALLATQPAQTRHHISKVEFPPSDLKLGSAFCGAYYSSHRRMTHAMLGCNSRL